MRATGLGFGFEVEGSCWGLGTKALHERFKKSAHDPFLASPYVFGVLSLCILWMCEAPK